MNLINDIGVDIQQANQEIFELMLMMQMYNQPNQEKYDIVKPLADRLDLYCDEHCVKCIEDCDFLSLSFDKIQSVDYDEDDDVLFLKLKKSKNLHVLNITNKTHIIYVHKEKHNCIFEFFLKIYNQIRLRFFCYKLKIQLIQYIKKQLITNKH